MVRQIGLGLLLCALLNPVVADDIDQVFTKSTSLSWGQRLEQFFGIADFNKSHAVVIGVNQFEAFDNLATTNDPVRMKDYLLNEAGFDSVRLITGKQVNLNKIRSIMQDEMPRLLGANDRFLFYWSGHGATEQGRNGKQFGYLPVSNSRKDAFSTMLSMNDLASWDDRLRAKQTLYLLDACFSGLASYQVKNDGRKQTLEQIARPSRQILTAGLASEETLVIDRLGGSVFTTALLDGLRGEADTSAGRFAKDGIISGRELELYVKKRVASESAKSGWRKSITPLLSQLDHREGDFFFFTEQTAAQSPLVKEVPRPLESGVVAQSGGQKPAPVRPTPAPAQSRVIEPQMVNIPAGTFTMGCVEGRDDVEGGCVDDEKPARQIRVSAFQMGKTEVTVAQYMACVQAGGCNKPEWESANAPSYYAEMGGALRGANYPIVGVSWRDAQAYVRWLSQQTGKRYRLPSEAEWEYAARAGSNAAYSWGSSTGKNRANCYSDRCGDSYKYTAPVASYAANSYGLHDMHGNVWEWVADCYVRYDSTAVHSYAVDTANCSQRVFRGGSWDLIPQSLRSAARNYIEPSYRDYSVGFRVAAG